MLGRNNLTVKKRAFTLAEVLITLGIIGVVAVMVIPTLMKEYQKTQTEAQLKKVYAEWSGLFKLIMAEENCSDLMCTGLFDSTLPVATSQDQIETKIKQHMNVVKTCKAGDTSCQRTISPAKGGTSYTGLTPADDKIMFLRADGVTFTFQNLYCASTPYPDKSKLKKNCALLSTDLNSEKPPNVFSKDLFVLGYLSQDGEIIPTLGTEYSKAYSGTETSAGAYWRVMPGGANSGNQGCGEPGKTINQSSDAIIDGVHCLARIIENGWKIDYWD